MSKMVRFSFPALCFFCCVVPASAFAHSSAAASYDAPPSILSYSWNGLSTGLGIGLASGYLATGKTFESNEWKTLVIGAGLGGVGGIGFGLLCGLGDLGARPDIPGAIIMRDIGYGSTLGTVGGLVIGAVVAVESGEPRDLLVGSALGTLTGAGVGFLIGIVEAAVTSSERSHLERSYGRGPEKRTRAQLRFTVGAGLDGAGQPMLLPTAYGRF